MHNFNHGVGAMSHVASRPICWRNGPSEAVTGHQWPT